MTDMIKEFDLETAKMVEVKKPPFDVASKDVEDKEAPASVEPVVI